MTKKDITLSRNLDGLMNSSKKVKCLVAVAAIGIPLVWLLYTMLLLGFGHAFLPESLQNLSKPTTFADFGEAFTALEGLASSLALVLGLAAILLQVKYNHAQNQISALSARLQFLVADHQRLDSAIARIYREKDKKSYSAARGMAKRRSRIKYELEDTDFEVRNLLMQLGLLTDDYADFPVDPGNEDQIKENVNKRVLVEGTVDAVVRDPDDRHALLKFKCLDVRITSDVLGWLEPLEKYEQQEIWVEGKLVKNKADSNGRPVIWVSKANQIEQFATSVRADDDATALKKNLGREVVADGVVAKTNIGKGDYGFLNFDGPLHVMLMPELCRKLKPLEGYVKKEIKVFGQLIEDKNGKLRIVVSDASQIELVDQES